MQKACIVHLSQPQMMLLAPTLCKANGSSRGTNMPGERQLCFINLMEELPIPKRHTA